jgi:hypothetical protein
MATPFRVRIEVGWEGDYRDGEEGNGDNLVSKKLSIFRTSLPPTPSRVGLTYILYCSKQWKGPLHLKGASLAYLVTSI